MTWSELDRDRFKLAVALRDQGQLAKAKVLLGSLVEEGLESAALFALLGGVHWDLGDVQGAINAFRRATELSPRSETASLGLFHVLWENSCQREALDEVKRFMGVSDSEDYRRIVEELNSHPPTP